MSPGFLKRKSMLAFVFAIGASLAVLGAVVANPFVLDWRVIGFGTVTANCAPFGPACTSTSTGTVQGTHIGSGSYNLTLTAGSDGTSPTGSNATNSSGGRCLPANGTSMASVAGTSVPVSNAITAANGDVIQFNTVGWLCEEGAPESSYHYNGTYRITSGTGRFSTVVGGGNLAATFEKGRVTNATFLKFDGTINF